MASGLQHYLYFMCDGFLLWYRICPCWPVWLTCIYNSEKNVFNAIYPFADYMFTCLLINIKCVLYIYLRVLCVFFLHHCIFIRECVDVDVQCGWCNACMCTSHNYITYHFRWTSPYIFGRVHINREEIVVLMLCKSDATSNMLDINSFMMIWTKIIQFHCRNRKKITKYAKSECPSPSGFLWKGPPTLRPLRSSGQVPAFCIWHW